MPNSIVLRLTRPFRSIDEYLEAEAEWITHKTMLLVGTEQLPADTVVRFGVELASGEWAIKAEACVTGYQNASASSPSGLMVRFKRYGSATKKILDRAAEIRTRRVDARNGLVRGERSQTDRATPTSTDSAAANDDSTVARCPPESLSPPSGVHTRVVRPVGAPANREELLARLRQRTLQRQREESDSIASASGEPSTRRATA